MSGAGSRARVLVLLATLAALALPVAPASAQGTLAADVRGAQVLVVGAPGLRWSDVGPATTPALHALAARSATGVLSVKALPAVSCPADGWLTLGAGSRAEAFDVPCGELDADRTPLRERNLSSRDAADVDALAGALRDAGSCLSTRGPGAALTGGEPLAPPTGANQGTAARGRDCPALLLDATGVGADGPARAAGLAAVDALVGAVDAARDEGSTLLVVGVSQAPTDTRAQLHVALAAGPGFPAGGLRSASTRRAPYVQLIDVAPTVLALLDVERPDAMAGQPWQAVAGHGAAQLADLERRADASSRAVVPFAVVLVAALLIGLAVAAARRSWRGVELVGLTGVGAVLGASLSALVPWWRSPQPFLTLVAVVGLTALVAAVLARRSPGTLGAATTLCAVLAVLLVLDLLTGARLQIDTPFGYSPVVAGRFAGMGNVGFGVYAAAVLLALAGLTHRGRPRTAAAVVAGAGLLAVAVLGAPPFGSDVGGVLALFPAVVLLALLRGGRAVTPLRLLLAGAGGVLVVVGFGLLDLLRPAAARSHLGRFLVQVADGTAATVLRRKAEAVLDLLLTNVATLSIPVVVAVAVLLVVRPPAALHRLFTSAPAWRHGVLAVGAASAVGFAANDSGPAIPVLALLVSVPATLAVVARRAQGGAADR